MSLSILLATLGAQVGSALINSRRNKAHSEKMAELQRAYEEKVTREGIENARAEFAKLCAFQREIEKQSQLDRLELIRANHERVLEDIAYSKSLAKWPLLVPPYVMANVPLIDDSAVEQCIPLNCILTTSSNLTFNNNVFHKLEEQIALFCSMYWNVSSNKSIRFYQEAWRDDAKNIGSRHKDIYAHLNNVPTLLISPVLKNDRLLFRYYWWGLSDMDSHIDDLNELDPELSISITQKMKYDDETISLIISECAPKLEAFISFFADMYYWNFYKEPPSLPLLIQENDINLLPSDYRSYKEQYTRQLTEYTDTKACLFEPSEKVSRLFESISLVADNTEISKCLSKYIKRKQTDGELTYYDLESLKKLQRIPDITDDLTNEIGTIISEIEDNEEIGYFPCAGKNDLLQTLLNQKVFIPDASYAVIVPINSLCSAIGFYGEHGNRIISISGQRRYIAVHPAYHIRENRRFSLTTYNLSKCGDIPEAIIDEVKAEISMPDIDELCASQEAFINALRCSYKSLKSVVWDDELELMDFTYKDISSIINSFCPKSVDPKFIYVVIGYSDALDNYTVSISLNTGNSIADDRFSCRSNSLDKTIRNKLKGKTIIKMRVK